MKLAKHVSGIIKPSSIIAGSAGLPFGAACKKVAKEKKRKNVFFINQNLNSPEIIPASSSINLASQVKEKYFPFEKVHPIKTPYLSLFFI